MRRNCVWRKSTCPSSSSSILHEQFGGRRNRRRARNGQRGVESGNAAIFSARSQERLRLRLSPIRSLPISWRLGSPPRKTNTLDEPVGALHLIDPFGCSLCASSDTAPVRQHPGGRKYWLMAVNSFLRAVFRKADDLDVASKGRCRRWFLCRLDQQLFLVFPEHFRRLFLGIVRSSFRRRNARKPRRENRLAATAVRIRFRSTYLRRRRSSMETPNAPQIDSQNANEI